MSKKSRSLSFLFKKEMNLTRAFEHNFWLGGGNLKVLKELIFKSSVYVSSTP